MAQSPEVRAAHVAANEREYGQDYGRLRRADPVVAGRAAEVRREVVASCGDGVAWAAGGTKPHYGPLSPGCAQCVAGDWSCLFVNGVCNARCFFCPTAQDDCGDPTTGRLAFQRAADYADFVAAFGFGGASLSGGEPLLTLERSLDFLRAVRSRLGDRIHLWLYTNGLLVTDEVLAALASAGLNEIRFNLHGGGYRLDGVAKAVRHLRTVTVETPAVPEEEERMRQLLPVLAELGVAHVNLHDLRVTPHNVQHMIRRGYTCLHGPKVTVLESELAALRLLRQAATDRLPLAVQYCCFAYKNPYQARAQRRRWGLRVLRPAETLTPAGVMRTCTVSASCETIASLIAGWRQAGVASDSWSVQDRGDRVHVVPELLRGIDPALASVTVSYAVGATVAAAGYHFLTTKVRVNDHFEIIVERRPQLANRVIPATDLASFLALASAGEAPLAVPTQFVDLIPFERLPAGLPDYY